jgi:hypothetical protein
MDIGQASFLLAISFSLIFSILKSDIEKMGLAFILSKLGLILSLMGAAVLILTALGNPLSVSAFDALGAVIIPFAIAHYRNIFFREK